jgi:FkbM family methyltransferase
MRRLYRGFLSHGDLVFDVGAHVGNRVRAFAALGCQVVAVEPQPDLAAVLRRIFAGSSLVQVVERAVSDAVGDGVLSLSDRNPTVATTSERWRDARLKDPRFAGVEWNRQINVEMTTLDRLIDQFGVPSFVKIDVEGAEPSVLAGLGRAVPHLSFEYLPGAFESVDACLARLETLGRYRFNWSRGETFRLGSDRWLEADELADRLRMSRERWTSGDVYARLTPVSA